MKFHIGHGVYEGKNSLAANLTYSKALAELLKRGVTMVDAQRALKNAQTGSHTTMTTKDDRAVIELVAYNNT